MDTSQLKQIISGMKDVQTLQHLQIALRDRLFELGSGEYINAKIYRVIYVVDGTTAYVGSTIRTLRCRWQAHILFFQSNLSSSWSKYVNSRGGHSRFRIELVENYGCKCKTELLKREKEHIANYNPPGNTAMKLKEKMVKTPDLPVTTKRKRAAIPLIDCKLNFEKLYCDYSSKKGSPFMLAKLQMFVTKDMLMKSTADSHQVAQTFESIRSQYKFRKLFFNLYHELHYSRDGHVMNEERMEMFKHIRAMCALLCIETSWSNNLIADEVITEKSAAIEEILKKAADCGVSIERPPSLHQAVAIRHRISSFFQSWSGCKLKGVGPRKNVPGTHNCRKVNANYILIKSHEMADILALIRSPEQPCTVTFDVFRDVFKKYM